MIILDVHARDVVSDFIRDSILDAREFDQEKQLRFYFDKERDGVIIKQCTDIIRTLTQALSMRYGGAPAGPAETCKTETVKDLTKGLALLCIVFNCSDGLNAAFIASLII
ncbi:MAG: hypothetical protein EZS28_052296 [Streblomastix strix]|uniref:Dynein heavy chain hydrolytic ATP-binding dynein motor region domain-containing protein n=1 Tax=Streblomastix strix TaxID=222440 RepID=A0A5J4SCT4_9EUKA|nr:MAG: hypothetical protein EZS28_052296 [Streblomastix strix]